MSSFWGRSWKLGSSAMPKTNSETGSVKKDADNEPPATSNKGSHMTHNSLFAADSRVLPDRHEKRKACWLPWKIYHLRKRLKMIINKMTHKKSAGDVEKEIHVTTTVEVTSRPAPPPSQHHITFSDDPSLSLADFASNEVPESLQTNLRPMTSPSHTVVVGAKRGHKRHFSAPFASSRPMFFHLSTHLEIRPRSSYHASRPEPDSILAQESEWTECLERATAMSVASCGTYESVENELEMKGEGFEERKRIDCEVGKAFLGRWKLGKRMKTSRKVDGDERTRRGLESQEVGESSGRLGFGDRGLSVLLPFPN
jgi:hypothetical protein